jgi:hypothetical protein
VGFQVGSPEYLTANSLRTNDPSAQVSLIVLITNRGNDVAQNVRLLLESNNQFLPVRSVATQGPGAECFPDSQNNTQVDVNDIPPHTQDYCDVFYSGPLVGNNPFRVAVYANGNSTQPALSHYYVCEPNSIGGENCHAA